MQLVDLHASILVYPELQKCCLTVIVAAVGAVDVNGLKIFNWPCKKMKNLHFRGHFENPLFMGVFFFKVLA